MLRCVKKMWEGACIRCCRGLSDRLVDRLVSDRLVSDRLIAALSKDSLSHEISDSRLLIDCEMLLIIRGGWLDFLLM